MGKDLSWEERLVIILTNENELLPIIGKECRAYIHGAKNSFTDRQRELFTGIYEKGHTLQECAKEQDITLDSAQDAEKELLAKLKSPVFIEGLKEHIIWTKVNDVDSEEKEAKFQKILQDISGDAADSKKLCDLFDVCSAWFARKSIDTLELSTRAYNCLSDYMDPPFLSPTGCHWSIDELLELKVGELKKVRNLGSKCFMEIIEKIKEFLLSDSSF